MTQFKNYFIVGLICLLLGGIIGWFSHKQPVKFLAGETCYEYKDTCISNKVIANITTETNTVETGGVKKGKSTTTTSTFPVEQVAKQDTDVVTTFSKSYNTGLMRMKVTATVTAKSSAVGKIAMEYELDTLTLKSMTTINNVVVVSKDTTNKVPDSVVKYLPLETCPKQTWVSLGGSMNMNPKNQLGYDFGLGVTSGRLNVSLFKDPTTQFKRLDGYRLGLNFNALRMSKK